MWHDYTEFNLNFKIMTKIRCDWAITHPLNKHYHDTEWGVPCFDDKILFEFLILEGMQAGLSWLTILKKRDNYHAALDGFDALKIARYTERKKQSLLNNAGIIRNRLKIDSIITNAKAYLNLREEGNTLSDYCWQFVDGKPIQNKWKTMKQMPASTNLSDQFSKDLKKRGFKFVGTTIFYSFMQATGMVNDHLVDCFRHHQIKKL